MTRSRRRALTLVELLVAMSLLGLITTATLTMFLPTLDRYAGADTTYDAQRTTLAGIRMMTADLKEAQLHLLEYKVPSPSPSPLAPIPLTLAPPTTRLAIPIARDPAGSYVIDQAPFYPNDFGTPDWQGWAIYSCVPDDTISGTWKLLRQQVTGPVPAIATWDPLLNTNPQVGTLIAAGLQAATVTLQQTAGARGAATLVLQTRRLLHDMPTTFEGDNTVDMHY